VSVLLGVRFSGNPREAVCRLVDHTQHGGPDASRFRRPPAPFSRLDINNPVQGEGYVSIHRGIHGNGQLNPAMFDWRNPGAKITIRRIR